MFFPVSLLCRSDQKPARAPRFRLMAALLGAGGLGLLSACTPRQTPAKPVTASTNASSVSFYPYETGLTWTYIPEGEVNTLPYVLRALGPTIFQGQNTYAVQLTGRGAEQTWYRTYDASGIKLLGFTKPGATVVLNPAWQEAPPQSAWKVGLHWEGTSKIQVLSDDGKVQASGTLKYQYDVQDYRQVKLAAGTFNVYVVTRQISDDIGGLFPAAQQYWFTPYIGNVRTPESLLLTAKNFEVKGQPR